MATCKDCIHNEACGATANFFGGKEAGRDFRKYAERQNIELDCLDFKDKTRFVELPCKVGDTVYYITGIRNSLIKPAKIKEIILDDNGIKDLYVEGNGCNFENSFDIFYLAREEAEEKLKETQE